MKCQACDNREATHEIDKIHFCLFCAATYLASFEANNTKEELNERGD